MIKLRAIEPSDLELIYAWENAPENWAVSYTYAPFSREVLRQYIASAVNDIYTNRQLRLMIDLQENGTVTTIGNIDLFDFEPHHRRAGVGILIDAAHRQKGHAAQALAQLIHYAFNTLNLQQLYCNIAVDNEPSLRLFTGNGFEITGTKKQWLNVKGRWVDEHTLQLVRAV